MSNTATGRDFTELTLGEIERVRDEARETQQKMAALAKEKKRAERKATRSERQRVYDTTRRAKMSPEKKKYFSKQRVAAQRLARQVHRFVKDHHPDVLAEFYAAQGSKSEVEAEGANT